MKKEIPFAVGIIIIVLAAVLAYALITYNQSQSILNGGTYQASNIGTTTPISASGTGSGATSTQNGNFAGPGEDCGGNMRNAKTCENGYTCEPNPSSSLPFGDVGGTCVSSGAQVKVMTGCETVNGHTVCF